MYNNKYNNNMTEQDYDFIKNNYQTMNLKEMAIVLNKAVPTISKSMQKLGISNCKGRGWTKEQIDFLKENYLKMDYKQIGIKFNKSKSSVQSKAKSLGLIKNEIIRAWTKEELDFLKNNINSKTYEEISKNINRSTSSIYNKVYELQLIPDELKYYRKLKKEQIDFIIANTDKITDNEFASRFQVSEQTISAVRKKYGIKKTGNEVKGPTYIEIFVQNILKENKISFIYNEFLGNYKPDFQIIGTNILIEVNGDYYHCNPKIYENGPKDEIQLKHIVRDYYKKCFYISKGYKILEIWEYDINHNPEKIKDLIKSAVLNQNSQKI